MLILFQAIEFEILHELNQKLNTVICLYSYFFQVQMPSQIYLLVLLRNYIIIWYFF